MKAVSWILILCGAGLLLALYATSLHYASDGSSICNIGETFNCDKVNKSAWSEFFGIPVAVLGAFSYAALFLLVWRRKMVAKALDFTEKDLWQYALFFVIVMTGFQLYLTAVEVFFIHAYCIICLVNQANILALLWLVYYRK